MAQKKMPPVQHSKQYSSEEELAGYIERIGARITELETFFAANPMDADALSAQRTKIINTLRDALGNDTPEFTPHEFFSLCDIEMGYGWEGRDEDTAIQNGYKKGIPKAVTVLKSIVSELEEKKQYFPKAEKPGSNKIQPKTVGNKVFIVHGHDVAAKDAMARFLEKIDLKAIILAEQPDGGETVIEKFEKHAAEASYAVVLLTPDDVGRTAAAKLKEDSDPTLPKSERPRARQNVILELGYFMGRLGRKNVTAMLKGNIEKPSDYEGVIYTSMSTESDEGWKLSLYRNLKAAGLPVNHEGL